MTEDMEQKPEHKASEGSTKITQAILWAAALIGSALILKGTEQADKVMWLLFVLAFTCTMTGGGLACERRLWRKLIGKSQ